MIVVLTATETAYGSVRSSLSDLRQHDGPAGTLFEVGEVSGRSVALALAGKGNQAAATLTERAITEFTPEAVFFVGAAGSLRSWLSDGDVVVATKIYAYHGGAESSAGFQARPRAWDAPHRLEQRARHVARSFTAAPVHFEPIAAGELLLGPGSSSASLLESVYNDAVAVDTESAGVAGAGHLNDATPTLTVRAIGSPAPAAAFALALIAALPSGSAARPTGRSAGSSTHNVFSGNSSGFVLQAGQIHGGVHYQGAPPPQQGDDLVDALTEAARSGALDETTYGRVTLALLEMKARPSDPAPLTVIRSLLAGRPELLALLPER